MKNVLKKLLALIMALSCTFMLNPIVSNADSTDIDALYNLTATKRFDADRFKIEAESALKKIESYSVAFSRDIPSENIEKTILFYSTDNLYRDAIQNLEREFVVVDGYETDQLNQGRLTADSINRLISKGIAKKIPNGLLSGTKVRFFKGQRDLNGKPFGDNVYYSYVATLDKEGIVTIYDSKEYIITAKSPKAKTDIVRDGKGVVYPIGGATIDVNYKYIGEQAAVGLNLKKGELPKIAIINSSRDYDTSLKYTFDTEDDPSWGTYETIFREAGMEIVWVPINYDTMYYYNNSEYYADLIKSCDAVYFMGGDQMLHARCLLNEDGSDNIFMEAIRYVYNRGGFITGTSAGLHIMSDPIYSIGENYDTMFMNISGQWGDISELTDNGETDDWIAGNNLYTHGVGLIPEGYLLDSHFDARGRLGRLLVALRDQVDGVEVGIGADESTGIHIQEVNGEMIGTIVGLRGVYFVDASNAVYSKPANDAQPSDFSVNGVIINYLTAGDQYNFDTREIKLASNKTRVIELNDIEYASSNIFREYATTKTLLELSTSTLDTAYGISKGFDAEVRFKVNFDKGDDYVAVTTKTPYPDTFVLNGYEVTSMLDIHVSVDKIGGPTLGGDKESPVIHGIRHYSKAYDAWIWIDDLESGIDQASITEETVKLISKVSTLYSAPKYYNTDDEIKITLDQDNFSAGDQIRIEGVKDLAGNVVATQVWEKQADGSWIKK